MSLSLDGHATLIRSVITGSFVHSFMIYKWPSSLLSLIIRKLRNSLWIGSCEETKLVWVAWDRCCWPYFRGGLGLKDLGLLNDSLLRKFTWIFMTSDCFGFSFLREKYLRQLQKPQGGYVTSWIWSSLWTKYSSLLKEVSEANHLEIGCMLNCMDDLLTFHRLGFWGRPSKAPVIMSVVWSPPASGWIKMNTDGAAIGFPGVGGCGDIF
ncbi:hypothetical protein Dsin_001823 [Dipteronia sinensis]|uniref:Uncharacterized protein n=1 Tax=Dipteronia sinensis TaxID=43782 RepID=A0AAE0EJD0_9ROSI|nr:hypothetical protein Dsin_001823 [Dipteronia sinensis]